MNMNWQKERGANCHNRNSRDTNHTKHQTASAITGNRINQSCNIDDRITSAQNLFLVLLFQLKALYHNSRIRKKKIKKS